jgi:hypothetical protein
MLGLAIEAIGHWQARTLPGCVTCADLVVNAGRLPAPVSNRDSACLADMAGTVLPPIRRLASSAMIRPGLPQAIFRRHHSLKSQMVTL